MQGLSNRAEFGLPQPCRLCPNKAYASREAWLQHVTDEHGGEQRYRNALFSLLSLAPYVTKGEEWRAIVGNFAEFFSRSATDWENFTPEMQRKAESAEGLS